MGQFLPNPRQQEAIEHVHGPMLVVAGAGTGKTNVLVERVACLLDHGHGRPDEILAVTYTDKAAAELSSRLQARIAKKLTACTFHSFCFGLLKRAGRDFRLLEDKDLWILLRRRLDKLPLNYYIKAANPAEFLDALLEFFSRCQDELVDAARFAAYVEELRAGKRPLPRVTRSSQTGALSPGEHLARCEEIAAVFACVERMLSQENLGTFGDMITRAVRLLRSDSDLLRREQARARFLLIDEFQDANLAQIELARLLGGTEANVFAVGDPDQAIYRFRGASSAAFEEFLRRFPAARGVVLDENQRSTSHILQCAFAIIRENPPVDFLLAGGTKFKRKALRSARERRAQARGQTLLPTPVEIVLNQAVEQEAADVAAAIRALRDSGHAGSIAVLYRLHSHREEMARALAAQPAVPFVVKGMNALQTSLIRDLLASLGAVASLSDSESLFRVAALPGFRLDGEEMRRCLAAAGRDASFVSLLAGIPGGPRVLAAVERARAFAASVDWQAVPVAADVVRSFGFDLQSGLIQVFLRFLERWRAKPITSEGTLQEFLEYMDLFCQAGGSLEVPVEAEPGAVQLMTVHSAKGLEFDTVFVLRANSGSFPHSYREAVFEFPQELREMPLPGDSRDIHKQEERRLFHVAVTRARDSLIVHARRGRGRDGTPPGYIRELLQASDVKACWTRRDARPFTATIAAAAAAAGVTAWLLLPPSVALSDRGLSATTIDAYETCPLKFKLMCDWQIPGPASAALLYGNVVHAVLRDYHQALLAARPRSEGQVVELFRTLLAEARFDDDFQRTLYERLGARQLSAFLALRAQEPPPPVLRVEYDFRIKIEGVLVRGRMDRVDCLGAGRVRIIDFKTGSAYTQKKADDSLQLTIYAMAARQAWDAEPEELVIYNLEDNSAVVTERAQDALDEARDRVARVAAGIQAGCFDPNPDFHCRWCEYRNLCPGTEQKLYD